MSDAELLPVDNRLVGSLVDLHILLVRNPYLGLPGNHLSPLRQGKDMHGKRKEICHYDQQRLTYSIPKNLPSHFLFLRLYF